MAFSLDGIVIDRIQYGVAESSAGEILYVLNQLADATIEVSAETKEAKDAQGTLIKKFYNGKAATFTANNAIVDFNILGAATGTDKIVAGQDNKVVMPKIVTVKNGVATVALNGACEGTIRVVGLSNNGTKVANYKLGAAASATDFVFADGTLTLPTGVEAAEVATFMIKFDREVGENGSGVKIMNQADKYPRSIVLTLKALAVDPCTPDVVRGCYIKLPNFQVSPETSLSLTTDAQLEYKGDLAVDYCSPDKTLYEIYMAEEDEEE